MFREVVMCRSGSHTSEGRCISERYGCIRTDHIYRDRPYHLGWVEDIKEVTIPKEEYLIYEILPGDRHV
jgi:hypothetical protein